MGKIIAYLHVSLDGFVAGPNGELNWAKLDEELFDHVSKRIGATNTALYGRKTFEMMESYWPEAGNAPDASKHDIDHSAWYSKAKKLVLSKTLKKEEVDSNTTIISENIPDRLAEIKQNIAGEILVFGSPTAAHSLFDANVLDGFWLMLNPVVLGRGVPLFSNVKNKVELKLSPVTRQFTNGVTELNYTIDKA